MLKVQTEGFQFNNSKGQDIQSKLIFVGENNTQFKKVKKFAEDNNLKCLSYSEVEWATLEEIEQYIQDEELSKQVVDLPIGHRAVSSLDKVEAETIKTVIKNSGGNMIKAAQALKIARATLYRKMEKYGLNLKRQREEQFKQMKKIKKTA